MKKTLIFLCGIIISTAALAQNSVTVTHPHLANPSDKIIIKEYTNNYLTTIACSNSGNETTFIYSGTGMQAGEVTLEDYNVNDMAIVGDTLFFCGKQMSTGQGMIGFFNIPDFFLSSGPATIKTNLLAGEDGYAVYELTRMVALADASTQHRVVCIGICDNRGYSCLIDYNIDYNNWYWGGVIKNNNETLTDIKIVRDIDYAPYLVTAGFDLVYGRYINIRLYDASFAFSTLLPFNRCHVFCMDTSYVRPWLDGDVLLADAKDDAFATVSYRVAYDTNEHHKDIEKIHLGFYDFNLIRSNSVYGMLENYEVPRTSNIIRNMNQFIYNRQKNQMVFLHTYKTATSPDYISEYCEVDPATLSSSGIFQAYCNPNTRQFGLSQYWSVGKYILSGYDISSPTTFKYQMNTFGILSGCADPVNYKYDKPRTIESHNFTREFSYKRRQSNTEEIIRDEEEWPLYKKCQSDE